MMAQGDTTPPGGGIVTDGLKLWLDGTDRGGVPGKWIDKIGGSSYTLLGCEDRDNSVYFAGFNSESGGFTNAPDTKTVFSDQGTVEFAAKFSRPAAPSQGIFVSAFSEDIPVRLFACINDGIITLTTNVYRSGFILNPQLDRPYTVSCVTEYGYSNLKKLEAGGRDYYSNAHQQSYIGRGSSGRQFFGEIFSIRVYDRKLSPEEMMKNQKYDIDVYFGGSL